MWLEHLEIMIDRCVWAPYGLSISSESLVANKIQATPRFKTRAGHFYNGHASYNKIYHQILLGLDLILIHRASRLRLFVVDEKNEIHLILNSHLNTDKT